MSGSLSGRAAIITGGSLGIGWATAAAYVDAGADVVIWARDGAVLAAARTRLAERAQAGQRVLAEVCDVTDAARVEQCVARALEALGKVQILVNAAGVYGPMGLIDDVDWQAWCRAIEINLMGSVLPCRALLGHFRANRYGKIVQLSGGGATRPLPRLSAYAASKAAIARYVETLAAECAGTGIDVNSIAPGAVNTRLLDEVLAAGPERVGEAFYQSSLEQKAKGGTPPERGAALAVFLAAAASDGITGRLLAALWDPWESLPGRRAALAESDIYTLRRIVPEDRGLDWSKPG
jgi:NAD(P)-dependent dehydrogenase (short-subunit alcohol dehydrogenase family)